MNKRIRRVSELLRDIEDCIEDCKVTLGSGVDCLPEHYDLLMAIQKLGSQLYEIMLANKIFENLNHLDEEQQE